MDQNQFLEKVAGLVTTAADYNNMLTDAMVRKAFEGQLDEEQMGYVRDYLNQRNIRIVRSDEMEASGASAPDAGSGAVWAADEEATVNPNADAGLDADKGVAGDESPDEGRSAAGHPGNAGGQGSGKKSEDAGNKSEGTGNKSEGARKMKAPGSSGTGSAGSKDKKLFLAYKNDLEGIAVYPPTAEKELIERKCLGDEEARRILVEGNLHRVALYAGLYEGYGVPIMDLVQEGNLELILLVDEYETDSEEEFQTALRQRVMDAMERHLDEVNDHNDMKKRVTGLANKLLEASAELAELLDRQPTLEELAKHLNVPEDQIESVMKMSMDAMTVDESGLGGQ